MTRLLMAALLFLTTNETLADVKNKEKAKFELISSIEVLVNIDECKKSIRSNGDSSVLPRACNSLSHLSKYFFDVKKDKSAIDSYLRNEESKVSEDALKIIRTYGITKLGKMILSPKCVKNRDPVDLDIYLKKIRGLPVPELEEETIANKLEKDLENKEKNSLDEIIPMPIEPRNPAKVEDSTTAIELEFELEAD